MVDGELLEALTTNDGTYDAFADDIAVLNLYYGDPEFPGNPQMTFLMNICSIC